VLLPELTAPEATQLAERLLQPQGPLPPGLLCGVSAYPEAATATDALLESCRDALREASATQRVTVARVSAGASSHQRVRRRLRRDGEGFRRCMQRLEGQVLLEALHSAAGNQTEAARLLDLPRRTLVYKIKAHALNRS
jgi:DNA-binding NtrC family response regulator